MHPPTKGDDLTRDPERFPILGLAALTLTLLVAGAAFAGAAGQEGERGMGEGAMKPCALKADAVQASWQVLRRSEGDGKRRGDRATLAGAAPELPVLPYHMQ